MMYFILYLLGELYIALFPRDNTIDGIKIRNKTTMPLIVNILFFSFCITLLSIHFYRVLRKTKYAYSS